MPVDIEYPYSSDVVGLKFRAGGDYEATDKSRDPLPADSKIICVVKSGAGTLSTVTLSLVGKAAIDFWEVEHDITSAGPFTDCEIMAELFVAGASDGTDSIEHLDIGAAAKGAFKVKL